MNPRDFGPANDNGLNEREGKAQHGLLYLTPGLLLLPSELSKPHRSCSSVSTSSTRIAGSGKPATANGRRAMAWAREIGGRQHGPLIVGCLGNCFTQLLFW